MSSQYSDTPQTRVKLSVKLGILGGIIWGFMFTAYYSMLPNFEFAWKSATLCFVIMTVIILSLPHVYNAFKHARDKKVEEEKKNNED